MNNAAILPYIGMHALQIQNVKRNVVKKASIKELNNEVRPPVEYIDEKQYSHDKPKAQIVEQQMANNLVNEPNGTEITQLPEPASIDNNIGSQID